MLPFLARRRPPPVLNHPVRLLVQGSNHKVNALFFGQPLPAGMIPVPTQFEPSYLVNGATGEAVNFHPSQHRRIRGNKQAKHHVLWSVAGSDKHLKHQPGARSSLAFCVSLCEVLGLAFACACLLASSFDCCRPRVEDCATPQRLSIASATGPTEQRSTQCSAVQHSHTHEALHLL